MNAPAPLQSLQALTDEAARVMTICNACRYCEGYCAVFPAMERRLDFNAADVSYLAHLCHGCRGCYHACQYAPPHEFAVNVPATFAALRGASYRRYVWPGFMSGLYRRNGVAVAAVTALSVLLVLLLGVLLTDTTTLFGRHHGEGAFYEVVPHAVMAWPAGIVFTFSLLAIGISARRFWRDVDAGNIDAAALRDAGADSATLRNLSGGGEGCTFPAEVPSQTRRWLHQAVLYGFLLSFASTSVATVYHYLFGWQAPYGWLSLPVLLGTVGGVAMTVGCAGLLWQRRVNELADPSGSMNTAFTVLLLLTSVTGLALLALRETSLMGVLLLLHLGVVLGLFLLLPYSKFVHGVYRYLALVKNARERGG